MLSRRRSLITIIGVTIMFVLWQQNTNIRLYLTTTNDNKHNNNTFVPNIITPNLRENSGLMRTHTAVPTLNNTTCSVTILIWTTKYNKENWLGKGQASCFGYGCLFTNNRSLVEKADAIVFFWPETKIHDLPAVRYPWQKWIFYNQEAPWFGRNHNVSHFKSSFNITITYQQDSTIWYPYGMCQKLSSTFPSVKNVPNFKNRKQIAWFVSRCKAKSRRMDYVNELKKYIDVDIYGKCGSLLCSDNMNRSLSCYKPTLHTKYRFYLAFENSFCKDYLTEKVYNILRHRIDVVPIVLGGADYKKFLPPHSYIDVQDFTSPKKLAEYLMKLGQNESMYNEFFEWRRRYKCSGIPKGIACTLCKYLHQNKQKIDLVPNLETFWSEENNCKLP